MTEKEVIHKKERFTFPRCRLFRLRCWLHLRHSTAGRARSLDARSAQLTVANQRAVSEANNQPPRAVTRDG
jgi:hypothetical protein